MNTAIKGLKTFYINTGNTGKENLLVLHGWGADVGTMMPIINILKEYYNVIAFDFPAHGGTEMPNGDWTVKDYADFTMGLINELKIKKCHVLAHSFGARIAVEIAANKPEVFDKIILTGAAGLKKPQTAKQRRRQTSYKVMVGFYKLLSKIPFIKAKALALIDELRQKHSSKDYLALPKGMHQTFKNIVSYDQKSLLKKIKNNVLLIWGRDDSETTLWAAEIFRTEIPNSRLVIMQGGHFVFTSYPAAFCDFVLDFLGED
ncbi:MAG: alpha/beta hydrolase [Eubacteriales bacterium]|nr:alpha/beta hydrolase [Eubacteriales bacterium]